MLANAYRSEAGDSLQFSYCLHAMGKWRFHAIKIAFSPPIITRAIEGMET